MNYTNFQVLGVKQRARFLCVPGYERLSTRNCIDFLDWYFVNKESVLISRQSGCDIEINKLKELILG